MFVKHPFVLLIATLCCGTAMADRLAPITVTATLSDLPTTEAPGSISVVTREQMEDQGTESVMEALRGTPGITLQGIGSGGRKTVSLRGLEGRHTLVLVDGKRIPSSDDVIGPNTDYQFDWIPLQQIERIEVVRGPMSVLYGSDAMGGVINIITRRSAEQWQASYSVNGRLTDTDVSGDGHQVDVSLSGPLAESLALQLNLGNSRRAAVESRANPLVSVIEGKEKQQLGATLDWQINPDHSLRLEHISSDEERWYDTLSRNGTAYRSHYDIERRQDSLGWEGKLGNIVTNAKVYESEVDVRNSASNGIAATDPQNLAEQVISADAGFGVGTMQFLIVGVEHRNEELTHPELAGGSADVSQQSLFVQDEIDVGTHTRVTLGVRLDDHDVFGNETSPRLAVVWDTTNHLTLKASYGHGFRAPTIKQSTADYAFSAGIFTVLGNPDIKPETNDAVELTARYQREAWNVDVAVFDNRVKNLIDTRFDAMLGPVMQQWVYDNIDEARLRGSELSGTYHWQNGWSLQGNYQYLDAKDGDEQRLEKRPRHAMGLSGSWEQGPWKASLKGEYLADQVIVSSATNILAEVPDYGLMHASVRRTLTPTLDLLAGIDNLTDVRLEEKSTGFRHEEYPRTLWLALRGRF